MQVAWVSTLKTDPAFVELLSFYRERVDVSFEDTLSHIGGLAKDAVVELRDRLEEDPETFSNKQLLEILTAMADRSGNGPTSTQVSINTNLASRIDMARQRAKAARLASIDVDFIPVEDETVAQNDD